MRPRLCHALAGCARPGRTPAEETDRQSEQTQTQRTGGERHFSHGASLERQDNSSLGEAAHCDLLRLEGVVVPGETGQAVLETDSFGAFHGVFYLQIE